MDHAALTDWPPRLVAALLVGGGRDGIRRGFNKVAAAEASGREEWLLRCVHFAVRSASARLCEK